MGYVEQNLNPGETVVYQGRPHLMAVIWYLVFAFLCAVSGLNGLRLVVSWYVKGEHLPTEYLTASVAWIAFGLGLIGIGILALKATEMAVTNKRVIMKRGLFRKRIVELFLTHVESVSVDQGYIGRMLGYGTILLRGTGGTAEPFKRIVSPFEFRRQLQEQIEHVHAQ